MTSPAPDLPDVPRPGDVLAGKYRVERILGAGGMGVVLAAWHLVLERRVAVKFLLPAAAQLPDAGARFLREAKAAAALEGEHIARVLDVGTLENGAPYMVLEHLQGADLAAILKERGPWALAEAVDLLLQAVEAIAEAHARGILHRDLKPKNLFLTRRPDGAPLVKVLDFGLAKVLQGTQAPKDQSLTATSLIVGSIHYMSPEQIRGLKYADARTDIWALGVVLYEMLTGRRPFQGDSVPAVTAAIIADAPAPLSAFRLDIPPAMEALLDRCLEKDLTRRIQTVTELARGLAPFGSNRAMQSFESVARLLPETPFPGRPPARAELPSFTGADSLQRGQLPSWSGAEAATSAPTAQTTRPVTSPSQKRRAGRSRTLGAVLAGIVAILTVAGVLAWRFVFRTPDTVPTAPAGPDSAPESEPASESATPPASESATPPAWDSATASVSAPVSPPAPTEQARPPEPPAGAPVEAKPAGPTAKAVPAASAPKQARPQPTAEPLPKNPQDLKEKWD